MPLCQVGLALSHLFSFRNHTDLDQTVQGHEAILILLATAQDIVVRAKSIFAGIHRAWLVIDAVPATPFTPVIPAFLPLTVRPAVHALPGLLVARIDRRWVSVIAVQRLGHAGILNAGAHFAWGRFRALIIVDATAVDRGPDTKTFFAGDDVARFGLAVFRRSAVTLGKVGIANAGISPLDDHADLDQAIQLVEAILIRIATTREVFVLASSVYARIQRARLIVEAVSATASASIASAFHAGAFRLAHTDTVSANILWFRAIPAEATATIISAFLLLTIRQAEAHPVEALILLAQAEALAEAFAAVIVAAYGVGAIGYADVDGLAVSDFGTVVAVDLVCQFDDVHVRCRGNIGIRVQHRGNIKLPGTGIHHRLCLSDVLHSHVELHVARCNPVLYPHLAGFLVCGHIQHNRTTRRAGHPQNRGAEEAGPQHHGSNSLAYALTVHVLP